MSQRRAPFTINRSALEDGGRLLNLKHQVQASITYYDDGGLNGRYVDFRKGIHRIAVSGDQSWRQASKTLWHELGHAAQVERLGSRAALDAAIAREMDQAGISLRKGVKW